MIRRHSCPRLNPIRCDRHIYRFFAVLILAAGACANGATRSSALDTRLSAEGYRENNVARNGITSSSGAYSTQPVWTIADGRRGSPYDASLSQYAYWASSTSTFCTRRGCWYPTWWVSVKFAAGPGIVCPMNECVHTISEIDLFSLQDNYTAGTDPAPGTITTLYGNVNFEFQYCPAGTTCSSDGTGWVTPADATITANNQAHVAATFSPVQANAVRVSWTKSTTAPTQSSTAYVVELEAWERKAPPTNCSNIKFATFPDDNVLPYVADDNSPASIKADSDRFWWRYFGPDGPLRAGDRNSPCNDGVPNGIPDDIDQIDCFLSSNSVVPGSKNPDGTPNPDGIGVWWAYGEYAASLVQMYDLLAPVDFERAMVYLERLRGLSEVFLKNRDDKRGGPLDVVHDNRIMPAWGAFRHELNYGWASDPGMSALFTYPMAAFARRVAEHPDWFCIEYRQAAVSFTTAVLETYEAFKVDMRLPAPEDSRWAYYVNVLDPEQKSLPFNESLAPLRAMSEIAAAADSELYLATSPPSSRLDDARKQAPLLIAKSVAWFASLGNGLELEDLNGTIGWHYWHYSARGGSGHRAPENMSHASYTLGSLLILWQNRAIIDGLLARYGFSERVEGVSALNSTMFTRIANTFLRRIWYNDYNTTDVRNLLTNRMDGPSGEPPSLGNDCTPTNECTPRNGNWLGGGFVGLAQFDPWVWVRSRDSVFNPFLDALPDCLYIPSLDHLNCVWPALGVGNHAALLRYR